VPFEEAVREAAFYGPKIDVQVRDHRGREETLSTVQLDVVLPERFDLVYTEADGRPHRPVLLHRSVTSTVERMVAHLLERHRGALPPWLAPWQLVVLPVAAEHEAAAGRVADAARAADLRAHVDQADRTLGARVRDARHRRTCWIAVVGDREVTDHTVALRLRDGRRLAPVPIAGAVARMADIIARRDRALW
jgi:threonyl-tRNA synthetase